MKFQTLDNVCNGGHLFALEDLTEKTLAQQLFSIGKAIAIVGNPPEINEDCDCEDCQNSEDTQQKARELFDSIVAAGDKGISITWKGSIERTTTLYAKRVGAWSESSVLYFIKTIPIE